MAKLRRAKSRKDMTVTTVALDEDLHRRLRLASIESKIPLTGILRTAARAWLEAWEKRRAKR
jgi:hypothetical protein